MVGKPGEVSPEVCQGTTGPTGYWKLPGLCANRTPPCSTITPTQTGSCGGSRPSSSTARTNPIRAPRRLPAKGASSAFTTRTLCPGSPVFSSSMSHLLNTPDLKSSDERLPFERQVVAVAGLEFQPLADECFPGLLHPLDADILNRDQRPLRNVHVEINGSGTRRRSWWCTLMAASGYPRLPKISPGTRFDHQIQPPRVILFNHLVAMRPSNSRFASAGTSPLKVNAMWTQRVPSIDSDGDVPRGCDHDERCTGGPRPPRPGRPRPKPNLLCGTRFSPVSDRSTRPFQAGPVSIGPSRGGSAQGGERFKAVSIADEAIRGSESRPPAATGRRLRQCRCRWGSSPIRPAA